MADERTRDCQACGTHTLCTKEDIGDGTKMWLCADNGPRRTCYDIAIDMRLARTMIDEHFALGYAMGRHDAGDIRARARETAFAAEYGDAMRRIRISGTRAPNWHRCFEMWLETGRIETED